MSAPLRFGDMCVAQDDDLGPRRIVRCYTDSRECAVLRGKPLALVFVEWWTRHGRMGAEMRTDELQRIGRLVYR